MRFLGWLGKEIGSGVVTAIVAALVLVLAGPLFLQTITDSIPTCDQPTGLKRVVFDDPEPPAFRNTLPPGVEDEDQLPARESEARLEDGSKQGSTVSGASAPYVVTQKTRGEAERTIDSSRTFAPQQAFDRSVASSWAVARRDMEAGRGNALTLAVGSDHDVVLVCAVNGAALSDFGYSRADRVHELQVDTVCDGETTSEVAYLRSMSVDRIQDGQDLNVKCPKIESMTLTIRSSYIGQEVTNSAGKPEPPTERVALSDVALYELGAGSTLAQRLAASLT